MQELSDSCYVPWCCSGPESPGSVEIIICFFDEFSLVLRTQKLIVFHLMRYLQKLLLSIARFGSDLESRMPWLASYSLKGNPTFYRRTCIACVHFPSLSQRLTTSESSVPMLSEDTVSGVTTSNSVEIACGIFRGSCELLLVNCCCQWCWRGRLNRTALLLSAMTNSEDV